MAALCTLNGSENGAEALTTSLLGAILADHTALARDGLFAAVHMTHQHQERVESSSGWAKGTCPASKRRAQITKCHGSR
jgi:hypothetical protein